MNKILLSVLLVILVISIIFLRQELNQRYNDSKSIKKVLKPNSHKNISLKNETLAHKAYKRIIKANLENKPLTLSLEIIFKIDNNVLTVDIEEDSEIIYQTFEFSDYSQLKIKKKKKNGVYIILPYETKVIV